MFITYRPRFFVISVIWTMLFSLAIRSQDRNVQPTGSTDNPSYSDNTAGLRKFIQQMLVLARDGNQSELKALIKQTEIPGYESWLTKTFGQEKGESWAGPYGTQLQENQEHFQERISQLALQDGEISVQKLDAGKTFDTLRGPLDYFLVEWKKTDSPKNAHGEPIGYFYWVEGKFRWDSNVQFMKVQRIDSVPPLPAGPSEQSPSSTESEGTVFTSGKDGVGYPVCLFCPDPALTDEAQTAKFRGTVLLSVIVQRDGRATHVQVIKAVGYGLDEVAVDAVKTWRFKPALGPKGQAVAVVIPIELTFRRAQ